MARLYLPFFPFCRANGGRMTSENNKPEGEVSSKYYEVEIFEGLTQEQLDEIRRQSEPIARAQGKEVKLIEVPLGSWKEEFSKYPQIKPDRNFANFLIYSVNYSMRELIQLAKSVGEIQTARAGKAREQRDSFLEVVASLIGAHERLLKHYVSINPLAVETVRMLLDLKKRIDIALGYGLAINGEILKFQEAGKKGGRKSVFEDDFKAFIEDHDQWRMWPDGKLQREFMNYLDRGGKSSFPDIRTIRRLKGEYL